MKPANIHKWPRRYSEIVQIQESFLAPKADLYGSVSDSGLVLGIECAFRESSHRVYCAAVLFRYPVLTEIERSLVSAEIPFPRNPEISSFREGQVITQALDKIEAHPDLIMVHGEGISGINGIGIATHLGIMYDIPTIGCSRKIPPAEKPRVRRQKHSQSKVVRDSREIGVALRAKEGVKSIYIYLLDTRSVWMIQHNW